MSDGTNKEIVRRFANEAINNADWHAFDELVAAELIEKSAPPGAPATREGLRALIEGFRTAFPDFKTTEDQLVAEGDSVVYFGTVRGTHQGTFMGVPATGRRIEIAEVQLQRVVDGKLVEHWGLFDMLALMHQIGQPEARA